MDCSPLGFSVHGILQARILEWVSLPPSGDLSNPGIKPRSPALQVDSLPSELPGKPFYAIGIKNLFLIGKNVLIVMVPILINKDVFEPCYNDLKFMV